MKRIALVISVVLFVLCLSACGAVENEKINIHVSGIELLQNEAGLCVDKPDKIQLTAVIYPADADKKDIEWISDNESIIHTDNDGNIYPCGKGTANISAKTADGGFEAKCAVTVTASEEKPDSSIPTDYTEYSISLYNMVMEQMKLSPIFYDTRNSEKNSPAELPAHDEEVEGFANPENFLTGYSKNQFLVLNEENGIEADALNAYLERKGVLSGKGEILKKSARENKISEVFLVLFACVQTKNGTSDASGGMEINGKTVYNVFGIGSQTKEDAECAGFAYEKEWTSIDEAIKGGAEWLSEKYINNRRQQQNTLYKMRWNPEAPGANQFTSEVSWADDVAHSIAPMLYAFPSARWRYDIPVLEKSRAVAG